jgi:branched-chain amino acid transport system substrate-binding protein
MRRPPLRLLIAVGLLAVPAAAGPGRAASAGTEPVVIGMVAPLTGALSAIGAGHRTGAEAAVRALNRQGGIKGRPVVLRLLDDASNPTPGIIRMQELAADPKVVAVIGSGSGSTGLASAPIASRTGVPYISMAPLHSLVYPPRPYVYTTAHTTRVVAYKLAAHMRKTGIRKIALLYGNTAVGLEAARVVKELAARYGLEIVVEQSWPVTSTTFVAELVRVKSSDAQAVWLWDAVNAVAITKEMRQLQLPQRLFLTHGAATQLYLQPACPDSNGATLAAPWSLVPRLLPDSNPSKRLTLAVDRLLGNDVSTFAYNAYTGVMMVAQALRAGALTRSAINAALERMTFVGPEGIHRFSPLKHAGLSADSLLVMRIRSCVPVPLSGQDLGG